MMLMLTMRAIEKCSCSDNTTEKSENAEGQAETKSFTFVLVGKLVLAVVDLTVRLLPCTLHWPARVS